MPLLDLTERNPLISGETRSSYGNWLFESPGRPKHQPTNSVARGAVDALRRAWPLDATVVDVVGSRLAFLTTRELDLVLTVVRVFIFSHLFDTW